MKFGIEKFAFKSDVSHDAEFNDYCHHHGLIATHQRMAIFRELASSGQHPDAETIYRRVKAKVPAISLDTVYRTLRVFEEKGMVSRVTTVSDRVRYDADVSDHPHFVCLSCGRVDDIDKFNVSDMVGIKDLKEVGSVSAVRLEFRGICKECGDKNKNR